MELAWHITVLPRLKRLPTLEKLQGGRSAPKAKMTSDQMLAIAMKWHRALNAPRNPAARRASANSQSPRKGDGHAQ